MHRIIRLQRCYLSTKIKSKEQQSLLEKQLADPKRAKWIAKIKRYDDDGNKIDKKGKKKKKKDKDKKREKEDGLSAEVLNMLLNKTSYTESEIHKWYANFVEECPSGKLSKAHLQRLFKRVFPIGDSEHFCDFIFRLFDEDQNNILEFKEFLQVSHF